MKLVFHASFVKQAEKLPQPIREKLAEVISDLQKAKQVKEIMHCKKLAGFKTAYRIKLGVYRVGFFYEKGTVALTTVLHRKEVYRYFP